MSDSSKIAIFAPAGGFSIDMSLNVSPVPGGAARCAISGALAGAAAKGRVIATAAATTTERRRFISVMRKILTFNPIAIPSRVTPSSRPKCSAVESLP